MPADRKFEILTPTWDKLTRITREIGSLGLLNPLGNTPVPLIDGELVQMIAGKFVRGTDATKPSFFQLEDRGDLGPQASKKISVILGGVFIVNTVLFDPSLTTEGVAVKLGSVNIDTVARAGLVAHGGTGLIKGYVLKPANINQGKLQVLITGP